MTPEAETIPALLALRAQADVPALVADGAALTYAELDAASAALAARLVAAGVVKYDRIGLLAPNGIEWAVVAYAALRIGAVLVPLSTLLRPPELRAHLTTAAVTHLVAVPELRGRHYLAELDAPPLLRAVWATDGLPQAEVPAALVRAMETRVRPADDLAILFTSGSTGPPKGVIHTHGSGIRATAAGLDARGIGPGTRLYIPMPFFWTGGFASGLLSTLVAGATLVTEAIPEPALTLDLLQRERVTLFRGWPGQAARLAAHPAFAEADLSSLTDFSLPALLPPERRPASGARANLFGMTETFGPYCGARLDTDLPPGKAGSCGRPFPGFEVRIAGPEGEIQVRGPNVLRGICGRARSDVFTVDGWYPTGDRGRLDEDGYLWYLGRLDDMFKVSGASVYPSEVEAALRSIDGVRQAHVTDAGAAVVTDLPVDVLIPALRERLSAFKVPPRWLVTSDPGEIPQTASGKVDKAALRARLCSEEGA